MAQSSTIVNNIRDNITDILKALEAVSPTNEKYVDLGGSDFVKQYLLDDAGNPVTDLSIEDFTTAMANLQELKAWLDAGHRAALMKLLR